MPKIVDERVRKDEIAEAAVQVFAENGFKETTVQQIADSADMSKGNIYIYFDSKEEVLQRVFQNFEKALHHLIDRTLESPGDAVERLKNLIDEIISLVRVNRATITVLFDFWTHSLHSEDQDLIDYESFYRSIHEKIETLLEDGIKNDVFYSESRTKLPSILIGFFEGQLIQWLINPASPPLDEVQEHGVRMILDGIVKA